MSHARIRRRLRSLLALPLTGLVVGLGACSDPTAPRGFPIGQYELILIDGHPLPYEVAGTEFLAGAITLTADATYTRSMTGLQMVDGERREVTDEREGTYTGTASRLRIRDEGGTWWAASIRDGLLTIDGDWVIFTFRKVPTPAD